jgi:YhcG PDDEXK nuclease domain
VQKLRFCEEFSMRAMNLQHITDYATYELKAKDFNPRDVGQMNFYLSAVDDKLRHPDDKPTIGILLCKTKKKLKVEYALRDFKKPIGVASYKTKLFESLPKELKSSLPTVKEIEAELSTVREISVSPVVQKQKNRRKKKS